MSRLRPEDVKNIEQFKSHHPIGKLLNLMRNWNRFAVGDVLVRHKVSQADGSKDLDTVSKDCPIPKKFRVVFIDELGIPWIKQMSVRGGLGSKLSNLVDAAYNSSYEFSIDQEQLDSILLGYKYDPRIEYKRLRESNPDYGKTK